MKCIYCKNDKVEEDFTHKEHVIPQAFGRFKNNFTLHSVCDKCNQYFGDNLEIVFNRDSIDAVNRYKYGTKSLDKLDQIKYKNILLIYPEPGKYYGVKFVFYNENSKIVLDIPAQCGIKEKNGYYKYFTLNELRILGLKSLEEFEKEGKIFIISKEDNEYKEIEAELNRLGIEHIKKEEFENLNLVEELDGETELHYKINDIILRTISKIGFNYLAFCIGAEFVLTEHFDEIRKYIRYGNENGRPEFKIDNGPILINENNNNMRKLGHIIVLEWGREGLDINVKISLYNNFTYTVRLVKNYKGLIFDLRNGHIFNILDKKIYKLSHFSKKLMI